MALIQLSVLPLKRAEEAYALVRLGSNWSESAWRDWMRRSGGERRAVLSATALGGVLLGLAAYEVRGRLLDVPLFVAFELGGKGAAREALRDGLDVVGERLGCQAVRFSEESRGLLVTSAA
jgi:hypothetical protein